MKTILSAFFWVSLYLALVLAPLAVLLTEEVPPGSGFWWDFSMALGFSGMGVQFFITARFRRASAPFKLKQTHRELPGDDLDALVIYLQSLHPG